MPKAFDYLPISIFLRSVTASLVVVIIVLVVVLVLQVLQRVFLSRKRIITVVARTNFQCNCASAIRWDMANVLRSRPLQIHLSSVLPFCPCLIAAHFLEHF